MRPPTERLFLDWNAGAPLAETARAAMTEAAMLCGNPSSIHGEGRAARAVVERVRRRLAEIVGVAPKAVMFVSGGTEANVTALAPGLTDGSGLGCGRLLVSAVEHPSVLAGGRFAPEQVRPIGVDAAGRLDLMALETALHECQEAGERALVSVMLANNETGVIEPVAEAAAIAHGHGALVHTDAVQALGKFAFDLPSLGADILTLSGHKIGAPRGVGVVVAASDAIRLPRLIAGGGQEYGHRAGTENVAAIAGLGALLEGFEDLARAWQATAAVRDAFEANVRDRWPEAVIFAGDAPRLPNTSALAFPGVPAELLLIALDMEGVAVSSGAACSSGKVARSHVITAMGFAPEVAAGAIRVSFGPGAADEQADRLLDALSGILARARRVVADDAEAVDFR